MADKRTISVKMDMTQDLRDLLTDLKKMDAESQKELKDQVSLISAWTANQIKQAAYASPMSKQADLIVPTVRFNRDRVPNVTIGGSKKAAVQRKRTDANPAPTVGEILFGNEFGAYPTSEAGRFPDGGRRFPFRSARVGRGNAGYWIFPTLKALQPEISQRWWNATDKIFRHWQRYG